MEIINDKYWLDYAKQSVINSIKARNEGAAKLQKMVLWFWGLYTTSFTIGISINLIDAPLWVLVFLGLPVITLIITYWLCVWTQLPIESTFDPRIPFEIKLGYNRSVTEKNRRFKFALAGTLISSIILASALFSLSFVKKKSNNTLSAHINENKDQLIVTGTFPKNTIVVTTLDSLNKNNHKVPFYTNRFKVQENQVFNLNIPLEVVPETIVITSIWNEKKEKKGFVQIIENK